jgi:hypothetical protein
MSIEPTLLGGEALVRNWAEELDLQIALRRVRAVTKAMRVAGATARARALAEQVDRPEYLVPLLYGQCEFHASRSEHKLALSLADQLGKIGEKRARALLERCIGGGDARMVGHLAVTLAYLGYIDQARSRLNEAFQESRRLKNAHKLSSMLLNGYWIASITCSPEVMKRYAEELLTVSTEYGFSFHLGCATIFRGSSLTAVGQAQEGLSQLEEGLSMVRASRFGNAPGCASEEMRLLPRRLRPGVMIDVQYEDVVSDLET